MLRIIDSIDGMRAIADEWNGLAGPFKNPMLCYEWFYSCAASLCPPGRLHIMAISDGAEAKVTAIAPLVLIKDDNKERLEILGMSSLAELGGFIYRDEESLRELIAAIGREKKACLFHRLGLETPEVRELSRLGGGKVIMREGKGSPFIPINTTWDDFEGKMSSDNRSSFRRKKKMLEKHGDIALEIFLPLPEKLAGYMEEIIEIEASGWKGREKTALKYDERLRNFFYGYAWAAQGLGTLRLCFLRVNGKAIAFILGVEYANRFMILKLGYDEEWTKCSPGILITHETVRYAFEKGLEAYELLGFEEPWLSRWTDQSHPCVTVRVYPYSLNGLQGFTSDTFNFIRKKAFRPS